MAELIENVAQLKGRNVLLVMEESTQVIDKFEAARLATVDGLDLVMVQDGNVPVVKICDFKKIEYDRQKKKRGSSQPKVKHVHIGPHTQLHDLQRLAGQASGFIREGHHVFATMEVRGRDRQFEENIRSQFEKFVGMVSGAKPGKLSKNSNTYSQSLN